jgi:hypothetical protein
LKGGGEVSLTFEFPGHQARFSQGRHRQGEEEEAAGALEGAAEQARDPRDRQGRKQDDRTRNIEAQLLGPAYLRGMVSHSTFNPSFSVSTINLSLSHPPTGARSTKFQSRRSSTRPSATNSVGPSKWPTKTTSSKPQPTLKILSFNCFHFQSY